MKFRELFHGCMASLYISITVAGLALFVDCSIPAAMIAGGLTGAFFLKAYDGFGKNKEEVGVKEESRSIAP